MMETVVKKIVGAPKITGKVVTGISLFFFLMLLINIAFPYLRSLL